MKLQLELLIVASLFAYAYTKCTQADWAKFKEEYNKSYEDGEDDMNHYYTFCDNKLAIDDHNELYRLGQSTYELKISFLTDLNQGEQDAYNKKHGTKKTRKHPPRTYVETEDDVE